jgi:hypothetical protein
MPPERSTHGEEVVNKAVTRPYGRKDGNKNIRIPWDGVLLEELMTKFTHGLL